MKTNNIVYTLLGLCAVLFIAVGVYIYYTNPGGEAGPANSGSKAVADTPNEGAADHRVMKPVIPSDEKSDSDESKVDPSKIDKNKSDETPLKTNESTEATDDSQGNAESNKLGSADSDDDK